MTSSARVSAWLPLLLVALIMAALPAPASLADQQPAPRVQTTPSATLRYADEVCGGPSQPIAFSPSGMLATGCESGKVRVVHPLTGQLLWETAPLPKLAWLTFADPATLIAVSEDHVAVAFDTATHAERLRLTLPTNGEITSVHAAAQTLLVVHDNALKALSLTDGKLLSTSKVKGIVQSATLSTDGLQAAWATEAEGGPRLSWASVKSLPKPTQSDNPCDADSEYEVAAFSLRFSPDNASVAIHLYGDEQSSVCIIPLSEPAEAHLFPLELSIDHPLQSALQLSADGARLRLISEGGATDREGYSWGGLATIIIDPATGVTLAPSASDAWPYDPLAATLPDGQPAWALTFRGNGPAVSALLPLEGTRPLRYLPHSDLSPKEGIYGLAVGPGARMMVIHDHQRALILNGADPKRPMTQAPFSLTWDGVSPGTVGVHVFDDGADGGYAVVTEGETLTRWELGKPSPTTTYAAPANILSVSAGATPDQVITCHVSDKAAVFSALNTRTGAATPLADAPKLPTCPVQGSVGAGANRFLVNNGYPTKSISVFNRIGEVVSTQNLEDYPLDLAMSPNGEHVLIDIPESVVMILRADSFDTVLTLKQDDLNAFAFSPDSQWLAVSSQDDLQLIHLPSLKVISLKTPSPAAALAFSPESATLHTLHPSAHSVLTWAIPKP